MIKKTDAFVGSLLILGRKISNQIQLVVTFLVSIVVLWPILPSAFSADDTYDSFVPYQLNYSNQGTWEFIKSVTNSWKINQGRFFPGAIALGTYAHYFFPERAPYKILQLVVALVALLLLYVFVRVLSNSHASGIFVVLIALCCMQIHVQYDAVLQFSLQQPSLMIMLFTSMLSFIVSIRKLNWSLTILSAAFYLCALLTYETSVLLWPIFPLLLIIESPKKWKLRLLSTMMAPTAIVLNLLYLRGQVTATAPGYTSSFAAGPLLKTFAKQSIAVLPMSYTELRTPSFMLSFPHHLQLSVWYWWVGVICAGAISVLALMNIQVPPAKTRLGLFGIGAVLWFMPALVVAQTVRWQGEVVLGNGYITIYQGYFGFALVSVGVLLEIVARLQGKSRAIIKPLFAVVTVLIMVSISSVVINNRRAVAQYDAGSLWPREHFQRAIEAGVFSSVQDDSVVFTPQGEWWFNAPFVHWYGGPHVKTLISGRDEVNYSSCLSDLGSCQSRLAVEHAFFTYGRYLNEPRVTIVGALVKMTGTGGEIKGIRIDSASVYIDYPTASTSISDSESRCKSWLSNRMENLGVSTAITQIEVERATKNSCLAKLPSDTSFNPQLFTP